MARLSRNDWLEQGLEYLVQHGVDALTIANICSVLEVTKGSFYHHFKNRQAFLEALLQYWEETYTTQFIEFSVEGKTTLEQMHRLSRRIVETHNNSETVIRAWAQVDPIAKEYQERVDRRRIQFLYKLHLEISGNETYARTMANLAYTILIGSQQIMPPLNKSELSELFKLTESLVQKKEDS